MKPLYSITATLALLLLAANPVFAQNTNETHTIAPPSTTNWEIPSSAKKDDNVNIKYTGNKYVKSVKVVPLPTTVTINPNCLMMIKGETTNLTAEIYPDITGVDKSVTWSVTQGNAVTIDSDGKVTAVQEGNATVTVTTHTNNKTNVLTITVKPQADYYVAKVFSVSSTKKVYFSKGNLQYKPSSNTWRFADKQWDFVGGNGSNAGTVSGSTNVSAAGPWIDLFGFGMWLDEITDIAKITNTSTDDSEYAPSLNSDNEFASNKRTIESTAWMTLSANEWEYLINTRTNAANLYGVATVNGVNGLILLPDEWTDPKPCNKQFKSG